MGKGYGRNEGMRSRDKRRKEGDKAKEKINCKGGRNEINRSLTYFKGLSPQVCKHWTYMLYLKRILK
jgi:hypothetical protein